LVILLAGAGCTVGTNIQSSAGQSRNVAGGGTSQIFAQSERKAAPKLTGNLLDDSAFDPASHAGKVVVVNFWASWCKPCRAEIGGLEAVYQATKAQGVTFLGVDIRDGRDDGRSFVAGRATYPSLFDPAGKVALGFRDVPPNTIPATLVVDRRGRVATVIRRAIQRDELRAIVDSVAAER
jgi:thiol-disulfide isomerase/thioredoxin